MSNAINKIWGYVKLSLSYMWDISPPYHWIDGPLDAKEISPDGRHFILVSEEPVEVDRYTFGKLMLGEPLHIRSTKNNRAISIDRVVP